MKCVVILSRAPFDFAALRSGRAVIAPFVLSVTRRVKSKHERNTAQMI
jgi:hypothetical protein